MPFRSPLRHPIATASLLRGLMLTPSLSTAATIELAGVKLEERITLAGSPQVLNGAGIRCKAVFKVYAAGLYLSSKAATPEEALKTAGPKRIVITMLRHITSRELGKLFLRGMEDNMDRAEFSKLTPGVVRVSQVFSGHKQLKEGETFVGHWMPGNGTVLTVKGVAQGEPFKGPEFFNALMRIWRGKKPADWQLKEALLGQPSK